MVEFNGLLAQGSPPELATPEALERTFKRRLPEVRVFLENFPNHRRQEPSITLLGSENRCLLVPWRSLQLGEQLEYFVAGFRSHDLHSTHQHTDQLCRLWRDLKGKDGVRLLPW